METKKLTSVEAVANIKEWIDNKNNESLAENTPSTSANKTERNNIPTDITALGSEYR